MRLWLKDSERRPDPVQVPTDDRKPLIVGLIAWLIALAVVLLIEPITGIELAPWWMWTCVAGLVLGALGLLYTQRRRARENRRSR